MSVDERLRAMEKRLAQLEAMLRRENAGAVLTGPVTIVDAAGSAVVRIGGSQHPGGVVEMFDAAGEVRASIGVDGTDSGSVILWDRQGKPVASLDVENCGGRLKLDQTDRDDRVLAGGVVALADGGDELGGWVAVLGAGSEASASLGIETEGGTLYCEDGRGGVDEFPRRRSD